MVSDEELQEEFGEFGIELDDLCIIDKLKEISNDFNWDVRKLAEEWMAFSAGSNTYISLETLEEFKRKKFSDRRNKSNIVTKTTAIKRLHTTPESGMKILRTMTGRTPTSCCTSSETAIKRLHTTPESGMKMLRTMTGRTPTSFSSVVASAASATPAKRYKARENAGEVVFSYKFAGVLVKDISWKGHHQNVTVRSVDDEPLTERLIKYMFQKNLDKSEVLNKHIDKMALIFTSEVPTDYKCPLCHNLLCDPIQLIQCGHRFCNSCYLNFAGNASSRTHYCPIDSKEFQKSEVFQDRAWRNTIMSLKVRCKFKSCPWTGTLRSLLENHVNECDFEDIKCPDPNCNTVLSRSHLENHLRNDCLWRVVVCDFCEDNYAVCKEEVHKATCGGVPEKCVNGCSSTCIPRSQMKNHVESDCPLTVLPCQYRHVGCDEEILRHQMKGHLDQNIQKHLDYACDKIRDMGMDLREKTLQLTQLSNELSRNITGNGSLVWAIDNFKIRFRQAVNGIKPVLQSQSAVTGPYGYKFRSLVYLNGDAKAKGAYISLYIQLLKGEHDALRKWPFQQEVKFTLIDQQNDTDDRRNITKVFAPAGNNEGIVNFQRPIKSSNPGRGYAKFIPHDVIRTRRYIRDDVIFLKIEVEPTGMV